jgi:protein-histidine pros-kinase
MKLTTKYNLILISSLMVGLATIGASTYYILQKHAKDEVVKHAGVLMEAALAMRKYTITEIKPLLALQNKRNFLPQSVPSYAATQNFNALREIHPEYRYKEATLNPTNPRDRAADWESDIINEFRSNNEVKSITVMRDTPLGKTLYYARPIRITNKACLTCHGVIEDAPETMIKLYGPANGFGWKMDEVVGSQIVSVPLSLPVTRARDTFALLMSVTTATFLLLFIMLNLVIRKTFVKRIVNVSTIVEEVNQGKAQRATCDTRGTDEIAALCESVEHLCKQYEKTNKMLDESMEFEGVITQRTD